MYDFVPEWLTNKGVFDPNDFWPFAENEDGVLAGPGHQPPYVFAYAALAYRAIGEDKHLDTITPVDIQRVAKRVQHVWAIYDSEGEWYHPATSKVRGAFPITLLDNLYINDHKE